MIIKSVSGRSIRGCIQIKRFFLLKSVFIWKKLVIFIITSFKTNIKTIKHSFNVKEKNKIIYSFFILVVITFQVLSLTLFKYDLDLYNIFIKEFMWWYIFLRCE